MRSLKLRLRLRKIPFVRKVYWFLTVNSTYYYTKYLRFRYSNKLWLNQLNIEFCSYCDLRCKWCSLDHSKPPSVLDIGFFKYILDDVGSNHSYRIKTIHLHNGGETILHPQFTKMMEVVGKAKKRYRRFPVVTLLTNARTLNDKKIKAILDNKAIDVMRFSIDGGDKESFEAIRRGAKWENILANVNRFLDLNEIAGKPCLTAIISIMPAGSHVSPAFKELIQRVDTYRPRKPYNWDGSIPLGLTPNGKQPSGFCCFILDQMVILPNGKVTACCGDLNRHIIIGDATKESLIDIYKGARRVKIIENMRRGNRKLNELCKNCFLR